MASHTMLQPASSLLQRALALRAMDVVVAPPALQTKIDMNATLLVSWWCTGFSLAIIIVRVCGRYVRNEKWFREDRLMFWSLVPLFVRMAFVHVILIWGTNNTVTDGLTEVDIRHREIGSRFVLITRIAYAAFIWNTKFSILEFLKRCTGQFWRRSHELGLVIIRYYLFITFIAVVIATLAECQPFDHYWQVVPDPGPRCRQGYVQLMTMGACDVTSDLLLVFFPISIVLMSRMRMKRKTSLASLFALSLILVGITLYRVVAVIDRRGSQQFRSLMASLEILAAAAVSNAVVIGSFIRDRGVKKQKYKRYSVTDSVEYQGSARRPTIATNHWGSDADLVSDVGMRLDPEIQSQFARRDSSIARPAPAADPAQLEFERNWRFGRNSMVTNVDDSNASTSDDVIMPMTDDHHTQTNERPQHGSTSSRNRFLPNIRIPSSNPTTSLQVNTTTPSPKSQPHALSFFDVGGLLESNTVQQNGSSGDASGRRGSLGVPGNVSPSSSNRSSLSPSMTHVQDFARQQRNYVRFGGRAVLNDVGGLISNPNDRSSGSNDSGDIPLQPPSPVATRRASLSPSLSSTYRTAPPPPLQGILRSRNNSAAAAAPEHVHQQSSHVGSSLAPSPLPSPRRASIATTTVSYPTSTSSTQVQSPSTPTTARATTPATLRPSTAGGSSTATTAVAPASYAYGGAANRAGNNGNGNAGRGNARRGGNAVDGMMLNDAGGLLGSD